MTRTRSGLCPSGPVAALRPRLALWISDPIGGSPSRRLAVETKQQILNVMQELPDDASVEDALDRLYMLYKIEKGLRQADGGELIGQEEARQRMAKWLK